MIRSQSENDQYILKLLQDLKMRKEVPLGRVAFLSPVVGEQFQSGIKRVTNLLESAGVPYIPLYNDMKDEMPKKVQQKQSRQQVNLMTIHGSKGLEFDVVVLMTLVDRMMYQEQYDQQFFISQNMNLIYVALTRARKRLIIIHDESRVPGQKHICSVFSLIPRSLYSVEGDIQLHLDTIEAKLNARRQLVDEDAPFAQMHRV